MKEVLATAIALSAERHKGQYDKGGMPYILHPLKVMHYLKTDDLELMAIAVLHDVAEDTDTTFEELELLGMTMRIINALKLLTKQKGQTSEEYLLGILSNFDTIRVKLADIRHNTDIRRLKGITEKDVARMRKYQDMYVRLKAAYAEHCM
jgi:(p)ppGpp synthase/HD superfamily hydrolase